MNKYRNVAIIIDGRRFHSKAEGQRYKELKLLQAGTIIRDLECQPTFELQPKFMNNRGVKRRAITYTADFMYDERLVHEDDTFTWVTVVEDVKSAVTAKNQAYIIKRNLFEFKYMDKYSFREEIR
jgi:hypothetical protein